MKHYMTGYKPNNDEQVFKVSLPLELATLRDIMQWTDDGECVFDHDLTRLQIKKIERASKMKFPTDLELVLITESD